MKLSAEEIQEMRARVAAIYGPGTLDIEHSRIFGTTVCFHPEGSDILPDVDFLFYQDRGCLVLDEICL